MMTGKIALTACSDGLAPSQASEINALLGVLTAAGYEAILSPLLYQAPLPDGSLFCCSGTGEERAGVLMDFYRDPEITAICDVSGGDAACELIPFLDFDVIARSGKAFWGYSDLTTLLNSIQKKTGTPGVLYQLRHLPYLGFSGEALASVLEHDSPLFSLDYEFVQGHHMEGVTAGGNIRCLLKLAGTPYWPDLTGKVLILESMGGKPALMISYLSQLRMLGVFEQISGILLGTFTQMEREELKPDMVTLVRSFAGPALPIAKTKQIGHGRKAHAITIGEYHSFG